MKIKFGNQIIKSYKRLSYKEWYALAEFVDNSTGAYIRNKPVLQKVMDAQGESFAVTIDYDNEDELKITDNSMGMSQSELENALIIGQDPNDPTGRSKYGLGMKTAACWFGDCWTVTTKKFGETERITVTVDVNKIAGGDKDLHPIIEDGLPIEEHGTTITINKLNRKFAASTKGKIKNFLRSMYRKDFDKHGLKLFWMGNQLEWNYNEMIGNRLHINKDGSPMTRPFEFLVGKKKVEGWVGVFEKGSRKHAGFSIIQHDRVIKGWPDAYLPYPIFGDRRNDLVNQRLVGEIVLDAFDVSHTKDEVLFAENEQSELESKLADVCAEYRQFALNYRKYHSDEMSTEVSDFNGAINEFESELNSKLLTERLNLVVVPDQDGLDQIKRGIIDLVTKRVSPTLKVKVDDVEVLVYVDEKLSPAEPYVTIESTTSKKRVIIIINKCHPHWAQLNNQESILNFVRHCVYDGVSEWKAYNKYGNLNPDTIKMIKDSLLRVRMEMEVG